MSAKESLAPPRSPRTERRLAAILHADAYGYSRLINEDESGTLRVLTPALAMLRDLVQQHGGHAVGSRGDSLLAEFPSVVAAVQCAVEMQHELKAQNADLPETKRIAFRIGISLGEIVIDGEHPHGDGINIAVRIEGLAEPGEICLSESVHQQVKNKLPLQYEDLGPHQLKNIPEPVRVYRLVLNEAAWAVVGAARRDRLQPQRTDTPLRSRIRPVFLLVSVLLLGGIITFLYPSLLTLITRHSSLVTQEAQPPVLPLPDKPSIVVLPFINLSGDPEQEYFSDGLTEDLTSALSRLSGLFVISRNTAFFYKGKAVKLPDLSKELGVQYVLEGSVRKADGQVRVTTQLIDASQDHHLWSERYDRPLKDIFALQDEIVQKIVATLKLQLTLWEQGILVRKRTDNLEAYDFYLRGLESLWRAYYGTKKERNVQARQMFEKAIELDPYYAEAYTGLGFSHFFDWFYRWSPDPAQSQEQAFQVAQQAVALDDSLSISHQILGQVYLWKKQHEQAIAEVERAVAVAPNDADSHLHLGNILTFAGRLEEAIRSIEQAMRLNPRYPTVYPVSLAIAYRVAGRCEEALAPLQRAITLTPHFLQARVNLAMCYAELDRLEEAQAEVTELLRIYPSFSLELKRQTVPFKDPAVLEREVAALRKAGLK